MDVYDRSHIAGRKWVHYFRKFLMRELRYLLRQAEDLLPVHIKEYNFN